MSKLHVLDHPLIQHKVSMMRSVDTVTKDFRELADEISLLMAYEVTRDLPLEKREIETPICKTMANFISGRSIGVVPILRAGLGMVNGILTLVPNAKVGHIGLYRDPETHLPVEYYCKLPVDSEERTIIVVDPMLATGGSAVAAIDFIKQRGCKDIKLMNSINNTGVLIECGFLSNPEEEVKLLNEVYQGKIAFAIISALYEYLGEPES